MKKVSLSLLLSFNSFLSFSQLSISFPIARIVFQRDNENKAQFSVAGIVEETVDRVEARLVPMQSGMGLETPWQVIQSSPLNGVYNGQINGTGGWYRLEVRGIKNETQVVISSIERIGIGEVFIVAGQSNAEGQLVYPGAEIGTIEDRVSCIDSVIYKFDENKLDFKFSQLGNYKKIGPYNPVPWYWGRMGELLVKKLNVPVLFYGNALGGSSANWWARAANGEDLMAEQPLFIKTKGMPYRGVKGSLQHYASRTGLRAILWHQGESDRFESPEVYFSWLKTVIEHSRTDFEKDNLAWVVARVGNPGGQNMIINQLFNVFPGPNTDEMIPDLPNYRYIGHFAYEGLNIAARIWFESLTDQFFTTTQPKKPEQLLPVDITCSADKNKAIMKIKTNLTNNYWMDGILTNEREVSSGNYIFRAQNSRGIAYFTQNIGIDAYYLKQPIVKINGKATYCFGDNSNALSVDSQKNVQWNTGSTLTTIVPQVTGTYYSIKKSPYGCLLNSNSIGIKVNPKPQAQIITNKDPYICSSDSVLFSSANDFSTYIWSNGEKSKTIVAKQSGTYFLSVIDSNGCMSETVSSNLSVFDTPNVSEIKKTSPFIIQKNNDLNGAIKTQWYNGDQLLNTNGNVLKISGTGEYYVKNVIDYIWVKCSSKPSNKIVINDEDIKVKIIFYPNPIAENKNIFIESLVKIENIKIKIYDLVGKIYLETNIDSIDNQIKLDLGQLPPNHYILTFSSSLFSETKHLIIEK